MSTNFPGSLDTLTNPLGTDRVSTVDHAAQHANANDAIEALEAKVGANSSAVTTSHDYKLSEVAGGDKAVGKSASQTLTNKTLTGATIDSTSSVSEVAITLTDVTTNNASATKHGFAPKFPNNTTTFLRGDGTYAAPSTGSTAKTLIPLPNYGLKFSTTNAVEGQTISTNTIMRLGQVSIPYGMTINQISYYIAAVTTPGTIKIALFSEDGQTKIFEQTTASISTSGLKSTTISSPPTIASGIYWIAILSVSTTNLSIYVYLVEDTTIGDSFVRLVSGKAITSGTLTVTASTVPSTITPTSVTYANDSTLVCRLDN